MMVYVNEADYYGTYMGTVPEETFPRLALRASAYLDYITQDRAKDNAEMGAIKMCCCALIDQYYVIETAQKAADTGLSKVSADVPETKSETVGDWSRTLATGGESISSALSVSKSARELLSGICSEYLGHTGLLYRGGGRKCTLPTL